MAAEAAPTGKREAWAAFLARCPAFTGVDPDRLAALAAASEVVHLSQGERCGPESLGSALVPRRGGLLVLDRSERAVDLVAAAEFHAVQPERRYEAVDDTVAVLLPASAVEVAWSASSDRLRSFLAPPARGAPDGHGGRVESLMSSPVVSARADETCRAVAQRMREHHTSSVIVTRGDEHGIVTVRDICSRLVAEGRSVDDPVEGIASFPVRTIDVAALAFEALVEMIAGGVHHLPVTRRGAVVGILSSTDLLRARTHSPMFLRKRIDDATDVDGVQKALGGLPEVVSSLLAAGTPGGAVGRVVAAVTDRVVIRLLGLAEAELGPPPAPYGWLAFGSHGRREQTLHSDQDSGILLSPHLAPADEQWFARLGELLTDALERCGYARCGGGVMASNKRWRLDGDGWVQRFRRWTTTPTRQALVGSEIAFDVRTVAGGLDAATVINPVLEEAASRHLFLAHLAREAVSHRPPLGFLGRFIVDRSGQHPGTFDVKAGAMLPIADIGRLYALARGGRELTTDDRLAGAGAERQLSGDLAETLRAGYELALRLRLEGQLGKVAEGRKPDNRVDPDALPPFVRSQLKETFKAIRTAQETLESAYRTTMLG